MRYLVLILIVIFSSCRKDGSLSSVDLDPYEILNDINGHWVGTNQTAYRFFDWFAFDFRPISASHSHSISEGGTSQNIITSIFLVDYEGEQQVMARNGGWLGGQYRASYFLLDKAESNEQGNYYRLVDAVGGIDRSYIEFSFTGDSIYIDAYKDNSGSLDEPIHHMGFAGVNRNPSYAQPATDLFDFPQEVSEVNLNGQFENLIDPDSALFLEEEDDPFPKSDHAHLSDLFININRNVGSQDQDLLLFISKEPLISSDGSINQRNVDNAVIRTIDVRSDENNYLTTYLHPDDYFITIFADLDDNSIPSPGDFASVSISKLVDPDQLEEMLVDISLQL